MLTTQTTVFTTPAETDRAVADARAAGHSLYQLNTAKLQELRPDLILTQDLCDVCSIDLPAVRAAAAGIDPEPAVLSLNPSSFEDVLDDILAVGRAAGRERSATDALVTLRERFFHAADHVNAYADGPAVCFLEWTDPPFTAGHWTPQLIERAGGRHPLNPTAPFEDAGAGAGAQGAHRIAGPSRRIDPDDVTALNPDVVIVCPCGLGLDEVRAEARRLMAEAPWFASLRAVRGGRVALVDGSAMFNRPGPRLVDAYRWLVGYLNGLPSLIPDDFPWEPFAP